MAKDKHSDKHFMKLALQLAQHGIYTTSPNPAVGCVIVRDGEVIGKGYHHQAGQPHAEIMAMRNAQEHGYSVAGADVYVTLEPCSHYGRTPPCALALCDAHVKKVVVAMTDPNPKVAGRGIAMLRAAGIEVVEGVCQKAALELNRAFFYSITHKHPWVFVKYGMSLDAKLALANGESQWITGLESRSDVQRLRLWSDAIITSHVTVKTDNPRLNVRVHELPAEINEALEPSLLKQPLRIVIDSHASLCAGRNKRLLEPYSMFHDGENYLVVGTQDPFPEVQADATADSTADSSGVTATNKSKTFKTAQAGPVIVNKDATTPVKKCRKRSTKGDADTTSIAANAAAFSSEVELTPVKAKKANAAKRKATAGKNGKTENTEQDMVALGATNVATDGVTAEAGRELSQSQAAALASALAEAEKVTAAERESALMAEQEANDVFSKDQVKPSTFSSEEAAEVLEAITTKRKVKQSKKAAKTANVAKVAKAKDAKSTESVATDADIDSWLHFDPKAKVLMQGSNYRVEKFAPHVNLVLVPVVKDEDGREHASLEAVLNFLGDMDIRVAMVEAGAQLGSAFLSQHLVNECYCYVSPMVLGLGAQDVFALPQATTLQEALHLEITDVTILGHDVRLTFTLPRQEV